MDHKDAEETKEVRRLTLPTERPGANRGSQGRRGNQRGKVPYTTYRTNKPWIKDAEETKEVMPYTIGA